ncbi:NAD(P)-dependent oxidoreductase [Bacillus sp. JCM 19034]|uniref:NAD(P)-dependent oxidoreductase n=1 Tax=Bacillus sp. JCM 19034 TaxID=1481928 RepID=UPI0007811559|nr:NAD(P)-binding domain-containing protein [Bacillus sp. JCM 19034]
MEKSKQDRNVNERNKTVTVLGLGLMGQSLASTFLKNGFLTTVWNRSYKKGDDLVEKGATRAETVREAILASKVIIACVATYEVLMELLDPISDALSGHIIINLTSGTPDDARKMAKWIAQHDAQYLDGAIMAVPPMIGSPEAVIFYGGNLVLFKEYDPFLKVLGGNSVHLSEDPGVPLLYDLALLTMLYGVQQSWLHAHAMINRAGITASEFQPFIEEWLNYVIVPSFSNPEAAAMLDEANYKTDVSNLHTNTLALEHIIKACKELIIPFDWMVPLKANYEQLVAEGYGAESPERVFEMLRAKKLTD